jgi:hypothetical protein
MLQNSTDVQRVRVLQGLLTLQSSALVLIMLLPMNNQNLIP